MVEHADQGLHIGPAQHHLRHALGAVGHRHRRPADTEDAANIQTQALHGRLEAPTSISAARIALGYAAKKGHAPVALGVQLRHQFSHGLSVGKAQNGFILALVLTDRQTRTLPVAASLFITDIGVDWGKVMAMSSLIAIPPLIFTFVAARQIITGLTAGAVKG